MVPSERRFLRDAGVALALYLLLLGLLRLGVQPLSVPGYLLVLGFDALQNPLAPGLGGGAFQVAFGAYLLGLAALAAAIARRLRHRFRHAGRLRYGLAGVVLGPLAYAVAVGVALLVGALPAGWSPVAVAVVVGLLGLWTGRRLAARHERARGGA